MSRADLIQVLYTLSVALMVCTCMLAMWAAISNWKEWRSAKRRREAAEADWKIAEAENLRKRLDMAPLMELARPVEEPVKLVGWSVVVDQGNERGISFEEV